MSTEQKTVPIILVSPIDGTKKNYTLKICTWAEDMSRQARLCDANGNLNWREIWIDRMINHIVELDDKKVRSLDRWELSALIAKWIVYNDVNPENFLEDETKS